MNYNNDMEQGFSKLYDVILSHAILCNKEPTREQLFKLLDELDHLECKAFDISVEA